LSWTAKQSNNGWLALDRNGNGTIDSSKELFGNVTEQDSAAGSRPNGFTALAEFDKAVLGGNNDGKLTAQDAVWSRLLIWIDGNHNGISEKSELHKLSEFRICGDFPSV